MSVYTKTGGIRPRRSIFNLSYDKKFTCDMGGIYPVMCEEMVPGDTFKIGNEIVLRFQPLVAPILHEVNCYVHYFFVPYRLYTMKPDGKEFDWESFIRGYSIDYEHGNELIEDTQELPVWNPSNGKNVKGTLWDFFGFPVGVVPTGRLPLDFPRFAYNFIYNEYYRDQNVMSPVALTNEDILNRCWEKDYFTSALPWQQRGVAPSFPLSGFAPLQMLDGVMDSPTDVSHEDNPLKKNNFYKEYSTSSSNPWHPTSAVFVGPEVTSSNPNGSSYYHKVGIDLSNAVTFDVADVRLAFQIQKWLERNARGGARYTELLRAHFGVAPRDERLQRPEYIGGSKCPVIISEVQQNSASNISGGSTPQGNLAGRGLAADHQFCGKYTATEYGLIIGLMSIMPRTVYTQGINRQWLRRTRYDFYWPEFANLSEQAVEEVEIFASNNEVANKKIFGFQGRFNEMRQKQSMVCGGMRDTFNYWHLAREFQNAPTLAEDFLKCVPSKRVFAVQNEDTMVVNFLNIIRAVRPLPIEPEPGLVDHN